MNLVERLRKYSKIRYCSSKKDKFEMEVVKEFFEIKLKGKSEKFKLKVFIEINFQIII